MALCVGMWSIVRIRGDARRDAGLETRSAEPSSDAGSADWASCGMSRVLRVMMVMSTHSMHLHQTPKCPVGGLLNCRPMIKIARRMWHMM